MALTPFDSIIDSIEPRDFSFPETFVNHCRDINTPVAVVGNGGSLEELDDKTIDKINECRLLRCNWAFKDPSDIKKQYTLYFSQAYGSKREMEIVNQLDEHIENNKVSIFRYFIHILYNDHPMCTLATPGRIPVWPTSGIQMLLYAAFKMSMPEVHIAGIDMYTYKRPSRNMTKQETLDYLKKYGKKFSSSADNSAGLTMYKENLCLVTPSQWRDFVKNTGITEHFAEVDVLILMLCFAQFIIKNIPVHIYSCDILQNIYSETRDNMSIVKNYFAPIPDNIHNPVSRKSSYMMWRLINRVTDEVLPE